MTTAIRGFAVSWFALLAASAACGDERLEMLEEQAFREAVALAAPAVVRIETIGGLEQLAPGLTASGVTSGLIVTPDGRIVTSAFTFAGKPTSIVVTLPDGRRFPARKVATDRQRMITLLKIDASGLATAQVAPRSSYRVGQWAIALGRTFETDVPSVSVGVISALDRIWGKALQTDAKVSPVNYGGPLVDIEGRVLGVLAPLSPQATGEAAGVEWYDSGIGFAVPLVDILSVLERLESGTDLLPGLLGVTFRSRGLVGAEPLVDRVRLNSPADKAGVRKDDRIVGVDGRAVSSLMQLRHVLGRKYAGDELPLELQRGDMKLLVRLTLVGELPPYDAGYLGILPSRTKNAGAAVRVVLPDSPAATAGLEPLDQIVQWNDRVVATAADLADAVSRTAPGDAACVTIQRGDKRTTIEVQVAAYPSTVPPRVPADVDAAAVPADNPKTGRLNETLAGHDRDYWLYVPESYRASRPCGLMVFLGPPGAGLDNVVLRLWKSECDRRGIIMASPQPASPRGWTPNDLEFLHDVLARVKQDYSVASERVWLHASDSAATIAALWCFRERQQFRGLALVDAGLPAAPPDTDPEARLQLYFACDPLGSQHRAVQQSVQAARKARYPAVFATHPLPQGDYLGEAAVEELARWADSLDQI